MTTANKITIGRILMIPVFVTTAIYYGQSVLQGTPNEWLRWIAISVFVLASASDGLDGYIARHYNQKSRLGVILDPIADKGLLLTAITTLTFSNWHYEFPIWFFVLIVARDVVVVVGAMILLYFTSSAQVAPSMSGKIATALQMVCIAGAMLQVQWTLSLAGYSFLFLNFLVLLAGLFTFASGVGYVRGGIAQLQTAGHANT